MAMIPIYCPKCQSCVGVLSSLEDYANGKFGLEFAATPPDKTVLAKPCDQMEWSMRTKNCLRNEGIGTLGELVIKTEAELLRCPNFGRKSANEIKEVLRTMNLHLGMSL